MRCVKVGDTVTVHYIGTLDNGRIFDQRDVDEPLRFTLGTGVVFPSLEKDLVGMKVGEVKNIYLSAEEAYGPRLNANLLQVSRELFPKDKDLRIGQKLGIELGSDGQRVMRVHDFNEHLVVLDANHDLAGCDLTFALKLVSID